MMNSNICPKCNCTEIIERATVLVPQGHLDGSDAVCVQTVANPGAIFNQGKKKEPIYAYICRDCGFTELYVQSPGQL